MRIAGDDYRLRGPHACTVLTGAFQSLTGCRSAYTSFQPTGRHSPTVAVLAHGFTRHRKHMRGLAKHLASWGLAAVTLDLGHSKPWRNDHIKNGADMVALARHLRYGQAIYVGFSAGGLVALAAASIDDNALAMLGLDPVDWRQQGLKLAADLSIPAYGLIGEPSSFNVWNNGVAIFQNTFHSRVLRVEEANHCHFEFPTDPLCNLVGGRKPKRFLRFQIKETILALSTAFLLWQAGLSDEAASWWQAGQNNYEYLLKLGIISSVI
jgi:pimeloyl-ACP methyl ester carboxylesterase